MVSRGRKPGHDPFALERSPFGPFLGTVAGVRWSPTHGSRSSKQTLHLPSWMRKFLLEGAFSAVNASGARPSPPSSHIDIQKPVSFMLAEMQAT